MRPMDISLQFEVTPQPDDFTCGPCCLHAVYRYFGLELPLSDVLRQVPMLEEGGTLAVQLGIDALRRGFRATLHTFNIQVFDPTWFDPDPVVDLPAKLAEQRRHKRKRKLQAATDAYLEFLELGGRIRFAEPTPDLVRRPLEEGLPVLTGLSATFLYRDAREIPENNQSDDVRGMPVGHFVVLCGFDARTEEIQVGDPLESNPMAPGHVYAVPIDRVIGSILLGVLTYDANLLVLEPGEGQES